MECFNCGREFDEKHPEIACTIINTATGKEFNIRTVDIQPHKQVLALCRYCVRAVAIGFTNATDHLPYYKIKDFEYEYVEEDPDEQSTGC